MKTASIIVAALGLLGALATSASADTVIIRHGGHHCHMVKTVKFGPHGKTVIVRKVCG